MAYRVKVADTHAEREVCYSIRSEVYVCEKEWISERRAPYGLETDEHDDHAVQLLATDMNGNAAGTFRLILPSKSLALPIEIMFDVVPPRPDLACEMSRLIVRKPYRSSLHILAVGLYRAVFEEITVRGFERAYAILERPLLEGLRAMGFPFRQLGEEQYVFGDFTLPSECIPSEVVASLEASPLSSIYRLAEFFAAPFDGYVDEEMLRWTSDETVV